MQVNKSKLSIIEQHDYISLVTPNGRFTSGRSGSKASGLLATNGKAFEAIDQHVELLVKNRKTYGEAMRSLLNEKTLSGLWPDWDKVQVIDIKEGDKVIVPMRPKYGQGEVLELRKKNILVLFQTIGKVSFEPHMLEKVKQATV